MRINTTMIYYVLGILSGIVLSAFTLIAVAYFRPKIERTIQQTASILHTKGKILDPENEELGDWLDNLKKE